MVKMTLKEWSKIVLQLWKNMILQISFQKGFKWTKVFYLGTCITDQCYRTASIYDINMNQGISPCENFYQFACGNYHWVNPPKEYRSSVSAMDNLTDEIDKKILTYMKENCSTNEDIIGKICQFYKKCMNTGIIYARGLKSLKSGLNVIGFDLEPPFLIEDKSLPYNPTKILAKIHRYSVLTKFLFDIYVQLDPKKMEVNRICIEGTPMIINVMSNLYEENHFDIENYDDLIQENKQDDHFREALRVYIIKVIVFLYKESNVNVTKIQIKLLQKRINDVTNLLFKLEKTRVLNKYETNKTTDYKSILHLQQWSSNIQNCNGVKIEWIQYFMILFANIGKMKNTALFNEKDQIIMIRKPEQLKQILLILCNTNYETFFSAMWFVIVQSLTLVGPKPLQIYQNEYMLNIYKVKPASRQVICLNWIKQNFGFFIEYIMVKNKRASQNANKVISMTHHILYLLTVILQKVEWMDAITKSEALKKLNEITVYVSYLDMMKDLSILQNIYGPTLVIKTSFYDTLTTYLQKKHEDNLKRLFIFNNFHQKIQPDFSIALPKYYPNLIHLNIPSTALGFPLFDLGLPSLNYGTLGALIGHLLWHAFDTNGKNYDYQGTWRNWWTTWSTEKYEERSKCFEKIYESQYNGKFERKKIVNSMHVMENIANLIGFEVGLKAFRKYIKDQGREKKLIKFKNLNSDQLYTLAFANVRCTYISQRQSTISGDLIDEDDYNSLYSSQFNKVLMNSEEFSRIWNCKNGSPMNPVNKCRILP